MLLPTNLTYNMGDNIPKRIEEQRISKLLRYIPGYKGYKEKNIGMETDRLVRSRIASIIESGKNKLNSVFGSITKERFDDRARRINRLISKLYSLAEIVRRSPYGYTSILDVMKASEKELDNLVNLDVSLTELSQKIDETCQFALLAVKKRKFDDLDKALDQVDKFTERMKEILSRREETLLGMGDRRYHKS
jgi:hypothetical protein